MPILFDSEHNFQTGIFPISRYSNYESDENGEYDLRVMGAKSDFFVGFKNRVKSGEYKKYECVDDMCVIGQTPPKLRNRKGSLKWMNICAISLGS